MDGTADMTIMRNLSTWSWSRANEIRKDIMNMLQEKEQKRGEDESSSARQDCINMVCSLSKMAQVAVYAEHILGFDSDMQRCGTEFGGDEAVDMDVGCGEAAPALRHKILYYRRHRRRA